MSKKLKHDIVNSSVIIERTARNSAEIISRMARYFIEHPDGSIASPKQLQIIERSMSILTKESSNLTANVKELLEGCEN